ncbi:MAG: ribonuclease H-like domain-containing protein [Acidobacteria bacterium]|nr:ribonuclease H-like domain-containing protein [Acidobacteriota bacterium]
MRQVVLDIETIPCGVAEWKALSAKAPSLKKKVREDSALDWSLGHIVCIGLLLLEEEREYEACFAGPEEAEVLRKFWEEIRPDDYLIGHNLLGFDLPYIQARSVIRMVKPSRSFELRRYSTLSVFDTMQVWANWDRQKYPKLETLAAVFDLGGKGGSGDQVAKWFEAGDWERIKEYCMQDIRLTREIYLRFKAFGL